VITSCTLLLNTILFSKTRAFAYVERFGVYVVFAFSGSI